MIELNIDTGGTFTDCIGRLADRSIVRRKVLSNSSLRAKLIRIVTNQEIEVSTNWDLSRDLLAGYSLRFLGLDHKPILIKSFSPDTKCLWLDEPIPDAVNTGEWLLEVSADEEAPVLCARLITGTRLDEDFPNISMRLGSTKGTNALLEYKGAKTAMLVTKGFKDLLRIGDQQRPDIFARNVIKHPILAQEIFEVEERLDASGNILLAPDLKKFRKLIKGIDQNGITTIGLALMHSWVNPVHEKLLQNIIVDEGFQYVSASYELSKLIKYLHRLQTTEVNAYLSPIIDTYVRQISKQIKSERLWVMTSAGGLVKGENYLPKDSLLSGPAGGVVGAVSVGKASGMIKLISFDMGGTSTDVARYDRGLDYCFNLKVGAAQINSPALNIETVAAGGGSICRFDGYKLVVGPESAGAIPGPACYGAGGPLTITDINLLTGRLDASRFDIPVYPEASRERLQAVMKEIFLKKGEQAREVQVLNGFLMIANEIMAGAIKNISTAKGYDTAEYALVAFGGAGGLHACQIAELLNIRTILVPEDAGLLSAFGIGEALIERFAEKQILRIMDESFCMEDYLLPLEKESLQRLYNEGVGHEKAVIRSRKVFVRFVGQESSLEIPWISNERLLSDYKDAYVAIYGHWNENTAIEIESIRVVASVLETDITKPFKLSGASNSSTLSGEINATVISRNQLSKDQLVEGPCVIADSFSTTFLDKGWTCRLNEQNALVLDYKAKHDFRAEKSLAQEAKLELFSRRFMSIAENMGAMLQRTSMSVNVKERLDFSCAVVDEQGFLVANAPHIPVHLGSLGICVRSILKEFDLLEGDTIVSNHPAYGGSHLPDITLVSPVYHSDGQRIGFVVNRAHHAEIGGIKPGSMPPEARSLVEEGVVINPFYLTKGGKVNWSGMREILIAGEYPTRAVEENLADLNAALAANRKGQTELITLAEQFGIETVSRYMGLLKDHARLKTFETIRAYPVKKGKAVEYLDDGSVLVVNIMKRGSSFRIDFTGSGPVHPRNLNANPAIVHSVVMYVLRLLLAEDLPLNDGMLEAVEIILPEGMLNPVFVDDPSACPAVVGGNVEVSQRLTDTLLKALKLQAASQGTMNNILFGNDQFGYYETICGGCGAGPGFNGANAVHHHMTNTRITDPEILEYRYPVRLERFEIRHGSGGAGKYKGGDGVIRELQFLEQMELSVLTQRRKSGPYGMGGGGDGMAGRQVIRGAGEQGSRTAGQQDNRTAGEQGSWATGEQDNGVVGGGVLTLGSVCSVTVFPGDRLVVMTPGGGGYGTAEPDLETK